MMNKQTLRQCQLDVARLENAAKLAGNASKRLGELDAEYRNTLNDLKIAQDGLMTIAIWINFLNEKSAKKDFDDIHAKAMDTLAVISEANR